MHSIANPTIPAIGGRMNRHGASGLAAKERRPPARRTARHLSTGQRCFHSNKAANDPVQTSTTPTIATVWSACRQHRMSVLLSCALRADSSCAAAAPMVAAFSIENVSNVRFERSSSAIFLISSASRLFKSEMSTDSSSSTTTDRSVQKYAVENADKTASAANEMDDV